MKKNKIKRFFRLSAFSGLLALSAGALVSTSVLNDNNLTNLVQKSNSVNNDDQATTSNSTDFKKNSNTISSTTATADKTDSKTITVEPTDFTPSSTQSGTGTGAGTAQTSSTETIKDESILQYSANDDTGKTGYAEFVKYDNKNAVAMFLASNVTDSSVQNSAQGTGDTAQQASTYYAGSARWVVTSDDLLGAIGNSVNSSSYTLTFKAMLFSAGGNTSPPSLFVIGSVKKTTTTTQTKATDSSTDSSEGSYLFQINWLTTTSASISGDKTAGSYRLAAKLSTGTSFVDYNYLVMEGVSTNTMQVMYLPDQLSGTNSATPTNKDAQQTTSTNGTYEVKYVTVSNSTFNNNSQTLSSTSITISNYSSYIDASATYKPIYANRINSRFFFVFQNSSGFKSGASILIARSDQLTDSTNAAVTINKSTNFTNLKGDNLSNSSAIANSLSSITGVDNQKFKTNIYYNANSGPTSVANINLLLSIPNKSEQVYAVFDAISFTFTVNPSVYNSAPANDGFIYQVVPYYSLNSFNISGYYALTSTNKVYQLNTSFSYVKTMYDFNSSVFNVGNIYNIYTIPADNTGIWYAQMSDGTFAQMSNSTLLGQWDKLEASTSYEKPASFTILSQDEVNNSIFFRKVVNPAGNGFDSDFLNFIGGNTIWQSFLKLDSSTLDGRLPAGSNASVSVSIYNHTTGTDNYYFGTNPTNKLEPNKSNTLTLVFTQNLRQISASGSIETANQKSVIIGSATYTFYYGDGKINGNSPQSITYSSYDNFKNSTKMTIPAYVLNMYPTDIANQVSQTDTKNANLNSFVNYFLNMENIYNPNISLSGNNTNGVLTINVSVPYIWSNNSGSVTQNATWVFTFGTASSPFFNYNPFGYSGTGSNTSNASVTPVDDSFASNAANANIISNLKNKYATMLPSQVSKEQYYNDFLELGSAFTNQSYLNNGEIVLPTTDAENNITIVPNDLNGNAFVSITFPKIGPQSDQTFSFTTPSIFMTDSTASQSVYFAWKSNVTTIADDSNTQISSLLASNIASTLAANNTTKNNILAMLNNFAVFSDYYANMIVQNKIKVSASYDDSQGFLNISLAPANNISIPGINANDLNMTFTGFKKNGTSNYNVKTVSQTSNFKFGTYSADSNVSPSSVTQTDLLGSDLLKANTNLTTWVQSGLATINLTPSNLTGVLKVDVTLKNYVDGTNITPLKTFSINIGGFAKTSQSTNMIVWKTNASQSLTNQLPSTLVNNATSGEYANTASNANSVNLARLKYFANLSSDFDAALTSNPNSVTNFTMLPDDDKGTLTLSAVINQSGVSTVYSDTITGLKTSPSLEPTIAFNVTDTSNSVALTNLREMSPSQISINNSDLLQLFTISNSSDNYLTSIALNYDDYKGTLDVTVSVTDPTSNTQLATANQSYSGFVVTKDTSKGTNWGIVAAAIVVPFVVLLLPVFLYGYIQNRKDRKAIANRLSVRLQEEQDREKRKQRHLQLNKNRF